MSSSEDYLDSLLDSILGGGKPGDDEKQDSGEVAFAENRAAGDAGKAMSPDEIEEMLVSMGTLDGGEDKAQEQEQDSDVDEMEAMLAFMNEHNASVAENAQANDLSLDELDPGAAELSYESVDGLAPEEYAADKITPDGLTDLNSEELSLDNLGLGEEGLTDEGLDVFSLDDLDVREDSLMGTDGAEEGMQDGMSDFNLDNLSLDDLDFGEGSQMEADEMEESMQDGMSDFNLDNLSLDDLDVGDDSLAESSGMDDSMQNGMSDLNFDDLSLDNLSLEEPQLEGNTSDGSDLMSEEEIDRLLGSDMSFEEESTAPDEFALEETGEEDDDLSALLAGMEHDEDLSEIHDLLGEADQGVSADEDMLAMLEGVDGDDGIAFDLFENDEAAREAESIRELTPEEIAAREGGEEKEKKKKKRKKKLFGKKKNEDEEQEQPVEELGNDLEDLLGEVTVEKSDQGEAGEKKPGFFARVMNFLLESDEEDEDPLAAEVRAGNGGATGNISGENKELLRELSEEDKKGKKKKKDKKGKKKKDEEEEKEKKPKKEKKKKKEKKAKKTDSEVDLFAPPEKKLSKKKVIVVFFFCGTIAAGIILATSILPDYMQEQEARIAYDQREYREVYDLLYGKELNEQDELLFQRSKLILQMDRKLSSYENYVNLDMRLEALDALISGVERYQMVLPEAETYNVVSEVTDIYVQILGRLSSDFGVSEADAMDIIGSEDDEIYSQKLMDILNGIYSGDTGEDMSGARQDVLPEEEEIIERIGGLEEETPDVMPEEEIQDSQPEEEMMDENSDEGSEV